MLVLPLSAFFLLAWGAALAATASGQEPAEPRCAVVRTLFVPGGWCSALEYSRGRELLACGGELGDVVVLDAGSGEVRAVLEHDGEVRALRFGPGGHRLAVLAADLWLWDLDARHVVARCPAGGDGLDWSAGGGWIACVSHARTAALLRAADLTEVRRLALPGRAGSRRVVFSADDRLLTVEKVNGVATTFDTTSGALVEQTQVDGGRRDESRWPASGERALATATGIDIYRDEHRVRRYPAASLRARPQRATVTGDGRLVAVVTGAGRLHVFDARDGRRLQVAGVPPRAEPVSNRDRPELALLETEAPVHGRRRLRMTLWAVAVKPPRALPVRELSWTLARRPVMRRASPPRLVANGRYLLEDGFLLDARWPDAKPRELCGGDALELAAAADGGTLYALSVTASWPAGICSQLDAFGPSPGERLVRRLASPPVDLDVSLSLPRLLLATREDLYVFDGRTLQQLDRQPWTWSAVCALAADWVLGGTATRDRPGCGSLELWRMGTPAPAISVPVHGGVRALEASADGHTAVAMLSDRLLIVRAGW